MIELLRKRRSIRKFEDRSIEADKIEVLKEALLRSPSSRNLEPWEFTFVDDKDLPEKLSGSKQHGSAFLKGAALAVVVCADETKSDVWVEDCAIASVLVQLTAQSLGLGSCWAQIRKRMHTEDLTSEDYVNSVLDHPRPYRVLSIIGIGYPAENPAPISSKRLTSEKIHTHFS